MKYKYIFGRTKTQKYLELKENLLHLVAHKL